ncbi:5-oxoprolinase subunit PxpB [Cohnella yongneupensis]|uniref:5-oxoprolinase subunit PxpB n=1 Tax=Cohnella yongneupensis TaxID=425006 RepID=A0ABW0R0A1_9BACL
MTTSDFVIEPLGDRAFMLAWRAGDIPIQAVGAAMQHIRGLALPWLQELVPAYRSIAVHIRSSRLMVAQASEELLLKLEGFVASVAEYSPKLVELPVRYGGEHGPDLEASASRSGLTVQQFIREHSEVVYEVAMIGFAPGFPYLIGLPDRLAQPRRQTPRVTVPFGSVGIAGNQTGVYPVTSPGGWQIIGRTAMQLFRPEEEAPFLLAPGDRVKFVPADSDKQEVLATTDNKAPMYSKPTRHAAFTVTKPGMLTTVQDLGRPGWQAYGVTVGGAMDEYAMRTANILVGNGEDAAGLELTIIGPAFAVEQDMLIALSGADIDASANGEAIPMNKPVALRRGTTLAFGRVTAGCRTYMAIAGGIDVPKVMGSRSTDPRAKIGAAVAESESLGCGEPTALSLVLSDGLLRKARQEGRCWSTVPWQASGIGYARTSEGQRFVLLRITEGAEWEQFDQEARQALLESAYRVGTASNRMGIRLNGTALARLSSVELPSHGVAQGTVQVPPDGQPIVLAAGCQPTGGYPKLAHVIAADLPKLAQVAPGDQVRFERVDMDAAMQARQAQEQDLALLKAGVFARVCAWTTGGTLA